MEHSEQEMKISSTKIRRLRSERGWSQEQLALASGLSLRTIQRVEAEGNASRETRVCLAATFNVELIHLEDAVSPDVAVKPELSLLRYKVALIGAAVALVPVLLNMGGIIIMSSLLLSGLTMMIIPLTLYGGFGCYFTGQPRHASRSRRYVQVSFIATAIFLMFAFFATGNSNSAAISVAAQVSALALGIYFLLDCLLSRHQLHK